MSLDGLPARGQSDGMTPASREDPRTMFEKIWDAHLVRAAGADTPAILYVDLHLVHEVTSPQAFTGLRERGLKVRRPEPHGGDDGSLDADHAARPRRAASRSLDTAAATQIAALEKNCADFGIELHALGSERPGHRARHRAGAGPDAAGHDRSSAATATPARTARSARWRSASAPAKWRTCWRRSACCRASRKTLAVPVEGKLQPGRHRQGHHPGRDRAHRHRRRHRPRHRVPRLGDPRAVDGRAHDRLQHVDRGGRARGHDRARRHDVRVPGGPAARAARARRGTRRSRAGGSCRPTTARRSTATMTLDAADARADDHLRHQPGHGHPDHARADPARRPNADARASKALRVHGPRAGRAAAGPQGRRRVHRQLHQLAHLRPARGGRRAARGARSPTACACWWCRARSRSSGRPRPKGSTASSATPAPSGARRLLDVHRDERRSAAARASTRSAPATATSKDGRARAAARSSPARSPPPPPRSPARSPTRGSCGRNMEPSSRRSRRAPSCCPSTNVDTDQIIPARFLKVTSKAGLGEQLFADWRYDADGQPEAGLRAEPAGGRRARRSWSRATTSAAARRASTRRGRWSTTASAR